MQKRLLTGALLLCLSWAAAAQPYTPDDAWADANIARLADKSETARQRTEWFRDARLGMFIHWNPSCVCATEISWSKEFYEDDGERLEPNPRPSIEHYRPELSVWWSWMKPQIPARIYDNLYKSFYPGMFDADSIVLKAKEAGMKYIVMISKHHDGFCMYDTKETDFNVMQTPFHRDVLGEVADACHRHGMHFGIYYSQRDWHHPKYAWETLDAYNAFMRAQLRELLTKYAPVDVLFFDAEKPEDNVPNVWDTERLFKEIYTLAPDIVINDRCGVPGDYSTPEQQVGAMDLERTWESCMTFTGCWSWRGFTYPVIPLEQCLENIVSCAGGNGNLLMNVDILPTGQIDPREEDRLEQVGKWLRANGEAVYGTLGGPLAPQPWGVTTHRDGNVYVIVKDWEAFDGGLDFGSDGRKAPKGISAATLMDGTPVSYTYKKGRLQLQTAPEKQVPFTVIRLVTR